MRRDEEEVVKKAFVTGVAGQDGAYLSRFLVDQGYKVLGGVSSRNEKALWRLMELGLLADDNFMVVNHDVTDFSSTTELLSDFGPDEIYNLAAQSFVAESFRQPMRTFESTAIGPLIILEVIKALSLKAKFYQASSSEMFGLAQETPQQETTPFYPRSPYAIAKLAGHWTTVNYRESYGIFGSSGILFNHESPLRGPEFVTRKITNYFARFALGDNGVLKIGNLNSQRDWGFAGDYVKGMWGMLQLDEPDTFVLATGKTTTVRDFASMSARQVGLRLEFVGEGNSERAIDAGSGKVLIEVSPEFFRPAEVDILLGNSSKAAAAFGWSPETDLEDLCAMMVSKEIDRLKQN